VQVVGQPRLKLAQRLALGHLSGQLGAELRLAARALEEHDEPARHLQCQLAAVVLLDQSERQVHSGGDACRGGHVPVAHIDRIGLDAHLRVAPRQLGAGGPVGGGAAAVEQTGAGEQESAGADRGDAPGPARRIPHPLDQPLVGAGLADAAAAGHEQGVERPRLGQRLRDQRHAGGAQRPGLGGHDPDLIGIVAAQLAGGAEHLGGAEDVQGLDAWKGSNQDGAVRDACIVPRRCSGRKATYRTISATVARPWAVQRATIAHDPARARA
jgi:hypothetical protein